MATVTRVLPWRRNAAPTSVEVAPLVATYRARHPKANADAISRAYDVSKRAHAAQVRSSGEAYITHPLAVAGIVADLGLDDTTIAAALLHDAVEDTELTLDEVDDSFGPVVATSSTASPSSSASSSTRRRPSRPPPCGRCWWRWPRTSAS